METIHCSFVRCAVAATLVAGVIQAAVASTAANARPSPDPVADAKAAVLRILRDRASSLSGTGAARDHVLHRGGNCTQVGSHRRILCG